MSTAMINKIESNTDRETVYAPNIVIIERTKDEIEPYIGLRKYVLIHVLMQKPGGWYEAVEHCQSDCINHILQKAHRLNNRVQKLIAEDIAKESSRIRILSDALANDGCLQMGKEFFESYYHRIDEAQAKLNELIEALKNQVPSA